MRTPDKSLRIIVGALDQNVASTRTEYVEEIQGFFQKGSHDILRSFPSLASQMPLPSSVHN
jgi:hypothetical protein